MPVPAENIALEIVRKLQAAGHTAYFAGGCVRDRLMNREPKDFDVATSAHPEQVLALFPRSQQVGVAFGVVLVREKRAGVFLQVEVATFRSDGTYTDGRHPDAVRFTTPQEDAQRRDFTCNGLFFDPVANGGGGGLHDFVGGQADIQNKILRAIGNPEARFNEDHLRMLRAVRFAAKLGFEMEAGTRAAIQRHAEQIRTISRERVGEEMRMILADAARGTAVSLMEQLGLMERIWPVQASLAQKTKLPKVGETYERTERKDGTGEVGGDSIRGKSIGGSQAAAEGSGTGAILPDTQGPIVGADTLNNGNNPSASAQVSGLRRIDCLPKDIRRPLALAALCRDYENGRGVVEQLREALALSNLERDELAWLLDNLHSLMDREQWRRSITKKLLADPRWEALRALYLAERAGEDDAELAAWINQMRQEGVSPEPFVTGRDLIVLGGEPGKEFKEWLDSLYDRQLEGEFAAKDQALAAARKLVEP